MKIIKKDIPHLLLQAICISSFIFTAWLMYDYYKVKNSATKKAKKLARKETIRAAKEVEEFLVMLRPTVTPIVNDLNAGLLETEEEIIHRIQAKAPNISGIGVAFAPEAFEAGRRLFAPYYVEKNGEQQLVYLENYYDYTQGLFARYWDPIKKGPIFLEPFFDEASDTTEAEFAAPFFYPNLKPRGVVFANHSTEQIQYILRNLNLGQKGYGFIISKKGLYVAHPNTDLPESGKTIFEVSEEINNPELAAMAKSATEGFAGYIDHENVATGQPSWMFFEPIPSAGWSMVGVFVKDEVNLDPVLLSRKRTHIIISIALFLFLLFLIIIQIYTFSTRKLWLASIAYAILTLICIIFTWYQAKQTTFLKRQPANEVAIYDRPTLIQYLQSISPEEENLSALGGYSGSITPALPQEKIPPPQEKIVTPPKQEDLDTRLDTSGSVHTRNTQKNKKKKDTKTISTEQALDNVEKSLNQLNKNLAQTSKALAQEAGVTLEKSLIDDLFSDEHTPSDDEQKEDAIRPTLGIPIMPVDGKGAALKDKNARYNHIPTGIFLQSIEFSGPNNIEILGYLWQRFNRKEHSGLERGVVFPQATRIDGWRSDKAYEESTSEWDIIGWNIRHILEQDFSYSEYPFDSKFIQIQLWPENFDKGVMLTPDLEAYKVLNPTALPGIDPNIDFSNWSFTKSYFSYKKTAYPTNFGYYTASPFGTTNQSNKSNIPDLYFNIIANRDIVNVLIIDLFPLIIVFVILFVALVMGALGELQFNHIMGICTSLFFTVIIAHLRFRGSLPTEEVVFFEYLFFVAHFFILMTSLICIAYFLKAQFRFVRYGNLLLPRILFWPLLSTIILILSLIFFY